MSFSPDDEPAYAPRTQLALVQLIVGEKALEREEPLTRYRTMRDIEHFFEVANIEVSNPRGEGRGNLVRRLVKTQDRETFGRLCAAVVSPAEFAGAAALSHEAAADHLNAFLRADGAELVYNGTKYTVRRLNERRTVTAPVVAASILSDAYVLEQLDKCDDKLSGRDYDGAITNARTLLEAVLFELQAQLVGQRDDFGGDLPKLFKSVMKAMKLDDARPDLDDRFKDVVRGLVMTVNGLAPLRNKMSDGHAREHAPEPHQARAVVNASKTVAVFLVETFHHDARKAKA